MNPWLAQDPGQARAERFLLAQTPVWVGAVAAVVLSDALATWGDPQLAAFSCALAAIPWLGPLWLRRRGGPDPVPWALRFNVWVAIVVVIGSYFWSHYFFDLMGMVYGFRAEVHLEAAGLGKPGGDVPLFLYPLTHAYFVTYFVAMVAAARRVQRAVGGAWPITWVAVVTLSYAMAFAETLGMAIEPMRPYFHYRDNDRMLLWGSIPYGLVFVGALPLALRCARDPRTPWPEVLASALAAGMLGLVTLDVWAQLVGDL
jgi:cycloeucalenol cycloisomerase